MTSLYKIMTSRAHNGPIVISLALQNAQHLTLTNRISRLESRWGIVSLFTDTSDMSPSLIIFPSAAVCG